MNTMNIEKPVLLYPEPDATGGGESFDMSQAVMKEYESKPWEQGEEPAPQSGGDGEDLLQELTGTEEGGDGPKPDEEGDADPFDFTQESSEEASEEGEYTLDFGESFGGTDEVRAMITGHAKAAGLPADAAGRFVASVCDSLRAGVAEQRQAGQQELRKEWGRNFSANMEGTKRVLHDLLKSGVIKPEHVDAFKSPAVFRALNYLRTRMGEQGTKGTAKTAAASSKSELKDILENTDNPMNKILMNPMHPRYRETADYVNKLSGMPLY